MYEVISNIIGTFYHIFKSLKIRIHNFSYNINLIMAHAINYDMSHYLNDIFKYFNYMITGSKYLLTPTSLHLINIKNLISSTTCISHFIIYSEVLYSAIFCYFKREYFPIITLSVWNIKCESP